MKQKIGLALWRLRGSWERRIAIAAEHGLSALHIDMGGPGRDFPLEESNILKITREANRFGIDVRVLAINRLNDVGLCGTSSADELSALRLIEIATRSASAAGIPYVMIPIFKRSVPVDAADLSAIAVKLRSAAKRAKAVGVHVVCENTLPDHFLAEIEQQVSPYKIGTVFDCLNPIIANFDPMRQWQARRDSAIRDIHVKDQDVRGHHVELGTGIAGIEVTLSGLQKDMPSPYFILEGDYFTCSQDRIDADINALNRILNRP